jgi:hypothetical protein
VYPPKPRPFLCGTTLGLASFAELKRSLRERTQLRSFGGEPSQAGIQKDWHGGGRRLSE